MLDLTYPNVPLPVLLTVLALASTRVTHLIVIDEITQPIRDYAVNHSPRLDTLVHCPWCIGFWIALAATLVAFSLPPPITFFLSLPFAISYVTGFLVTLTDTLNHIQLRE